MNTLVSPRCLLALCISALAGLLTTPAHADPADIDAASRGVVRVIVIGKDGNEVYPIGHGTGFAVNAETIVTNAHVLQPAIDDTRLSIGIVPSDGGSAVYGRVISVSPRNDLALVKTTSPLRLPPLTLAGIAPGTSGSVTAIGYPMNVDQAQGLGEEDIFRAQPPVTSQGFLSGRRPSREFDTVLHTAPIARGNSGGPLVDECGRVIGVNSFGAESQGTEAEFFFAVTMRELVPFLRANGITPQINSLPCRSLADLEEEERERAERQQMVAQLQADADEESQAQRRAELRRQVEYAIFDERSNRQFLALLALIVLLAGAAYAHRAHKGGDMRMRAIAGSVALVALLLAAISWLSRPSFNEVGNRLEEQLREEMSGEDSGVIKTSAANGALYCSLDMARSRVLGAPVDTISMEWGTDGCVNGRTQYGLSGAEWSRTLVPANEEAVSVNRFDPANGEYVVERYLLDQASMTAARTARAEYEAPACGGGEAAARQLGGQQDAIQSLLPNNPNERLVYNCQPASGSEIPAGK